jgi:hypothetical protein
MAEMADARLVAQRMIEIYGDGAGAEAANRARDAKTAANQESADMWNQVRKAIEELKATL